MSMLFSFDLEEAFVTLISLDVASFFLFASDTVYENEPAFANETVSV